MKTSHGGREARHGAPHGLEFHSRAMSRTDKSKGRKIHGCLGLGAPGENAQGLLTGYEVFWRGDENVLKVILMTVAQHRTYQKSVDYNTLNG